MNSKLTFFLAFSHLNYPKQKSILAHTIFWENEGFSSGFFKFFFIWFDWIILDLSRWVPISSSSMVWKSMLHYVKTALVFASVSIVFIYSKNNIFPWLSRVNDKINARTYFARFFGTSWILYEVFSRAPQKTGQKKIIVISAFIGITWWMS